MKTKPKIIIIIFMTLIFITSIVTAMTFIILKNNEKIIINNKQLAVWQSGPLNKEDKKELENSNELSYFFGETEFNYATYKKNNNKYNFYGDEANVKRTKIYNNKIKLWKNDIAEEQIILFKNINADVVKNINVEILNDNEDINVSAHFVNPIKNNNTTNANNDLIPLGEFYTFDQVSNANNLDKMPLSFQPILIRYISNDKAVEGSLKIKISYSINNIQKEIMIDKEYKINDNLQYKSSDFGSSAMFFPNTSSKFILKNLNEVVTKRKIDYNEEDNIDFDDYETLNKIIKSENPLLPKDSEVYKIEPKDEFIRVWLKSKTYKYVTTAGEQIDYINIDFYKENNLEKLGVLTTESKATKVIGNYDYAIVDDITRTLPKYLDVNPLITRDNILGRKIKEMSQNSNYESISVPNFGLGNFIKYVFTPNEGEKNIINEFMGDNLEDIFMETNHKGFWKLDFKVFDRYVKFLKDSGVKNILIPIGSRGSSNMFNFFVKDSDQRAYQVSANSLYVNNKGEITEDGIAIINQMIPLLRDQLAIHATQNSDIYKDINIYYSYDEFSAEVNNLSIDIFKEINDTYKDFWKSHLYGGWEFKLESEDFEGLEKALDVYDYVTLQQREFIYEFSKSKEKLDDLIKYFNKRSYQNKKTHIYSSWNNYPATYLNSNGYEMLWAMLFSSKLGADGYDRYQVDGYKNDISLDGEVLDATKEPGDSFYIYPGDGNEMLDSLRYTNMVKGINLVNKAKVILNDNYNYIDYKDILQFTTNDENRYISEKWNLNYYDYNNNFSSNSLSGQATYINWLIKNYNF
ncbi:glycoside hydrolase domain-containing protein [Spiroplasma endosymbiont of Cantharis lateralis]|uniref:glycoside hydrolase domain-containing protein n=1 Tax=Spiroplasma endosymbiont of Cantharis lateralis TaxID=3066277 RepID=UPI00313C5ED5